MKPVILPVDKAGDSRTGTLKGITVQQVQNRIGFPPNVEDDPDKVKHSWGFTVDGERCAVWDYKGSEKFNQFSTFGPPATLLKVFGNFYRGDQ